MPPDERKIRLIEAHFTHMRDRLHFLPNGDIVVLQDGAEIELHLHHRFAVIFDLTASPRVTIFDQRADAENDMGNARTLIRRETLRSPPALIDFDTGTVESNPLDGDIPLADA